MASVVAIQIQVSDNGSVQLINQHTQALDQLGTVGETAGKRVSAGVSQIGGHATTGLDQVRLLSQEFGLRLPRAMEAALSRMPAVTNALAGVSGALLGIGAAEVFFRSAQGAYELYMKVFDVNKEVGKYLEQSGKAANTKLFEDASLETSVDLLREANAQIDALERKRHDAGADRVGGGFTQYVKQWIENAAIGEAGDALASQGVTRESLSPPVFSADDDAALAQAYANREVAQSRTNQLGRDMDLERLRNRNAASASSLQGYGQSSQQLKNALAEAKMVQDNLQAHERDLVRTTQSQRDAQIKAGMQLDDKALTPVHVIDPNAGAAERKTAELKAYEEFSTKTVELDRKSRDERIAAENEAITSGLEGEARYTAQREQAIAAIERKYHDAELNKDAYRRMLAATEEKFDNEAQSRLEKQMESAQKMLRDAQADGLKGIDRIQQQHEDRVQDINTDRALDPQAAALQRKAAEAQANNEIAALQDQFSERLQQMLDQRSAASIGAIGRIEAAAKHAHAELDQLFEERYGKDHTKWTADAQGAYVNAGAVLDKDADRQKAEQVAKNHAEDLRYEQEATQAEARVRSQGLTSWVTNYRAAVTEIRAMEDKRVADLKVQATAETLDKGEVEQRKADIVRSANAEIAAQEQQVQRQLAGTLEQAFTNPIDFIKSKMEQMFFEILAGWIMRLKLFQGTFSSTMGSLQPGGAQQGTSSIGGTIASALGGQMPRPTGTAGVIQGGMMLPSEGSAAGGTVQAYGAGTVPAGSPAGGGSTVSQAVGLTQHFANLFKDASGSKNAGGNTPWEDDGDPTTQSGSTPWEDDGDPTTQSTEMQTVGSGSNAAALSPLGVAATGYAAYQGGKGVYDSFFQTGAKGAMDGAMSGMEAGAAIGSFAGPVGTLVGGAIGAVAGLTTNLIGQATGEASKIQARAYYRQTLRPEIDGVVQSFEQGGGGGSYLSAVSEINSDASTGFSYMTRKFGKPAADWVKSNYLDKLVAIDTSQVEQMARGGAWAMTRSASQFHTGGVISDFRDLGTSSNEGYIHAMLGEGIVNEPAMRGGHAPMVQAINDGAGAAEMAGRYLAAAGITGSMGGASVTNNHTHNYSMLSTDGFREFLDNGGTQAINAAQNRRAALYGGDAIG